MINPQISTLQQIQQPGSQSIPAPVVQQLLSSLAQSSAPKPVNPAAQQAGAQTAAQTYGTAAAPGAAVAASSDTANLEKVLRDVGKAVYSEDRDALKAAREGYPDLFKNNQIFRAIEQQKKNYEDESQVGLGIVSNLMSSADRAAQAMTAAGVTPDDLKTQDPNILQRFGQRMNQIFKESNIAPDSPEAAGQKAFVYGLLKGMPFDQLSQYHSSIYKDLATADAVFKRTLNQKAASAAVDLQVEEVKRKRDIDRTRQGLAISLGGAGTDPDIIAPIADAVSGILYSAKDKPQEAEARARALMRTLTDQKIDQDALDRVADTLAPVVKGGAREAEIAGLQSFGVNKSVINRYKFGIETDADIAEVVKKRDAYERAELRRKNELELEGARAKIPLKVEEQAALIPGKVAEQAALLPGIVQEQAALLPGKVAEAQATTQAQELTKAKVEADIKLPASVNQGLQSIKAINELISNPAFTTGAVGFTGPIARLVGETFGGTRFTSFNRQLDIIKSRQFLDGIAAARSAGGALGGLSDAEGSRITSAQAALDPKLPPQEFIRQLNDLRTAVQDALNVTADRAGKPRTELPKLIAPGSRPPLDSFRR